MRIRAIVLTLMILSGGCERPPNVAQDFGAVTDPADVAAPPSQTAASAPSTVSIRDTQHSGLRTSPVRSGPTPGHKKMVALLGSIATQMPERPIPDEGRALSDLQKWRHHMLAGHLEANKGDERQSIVHFSKAYRLLPGLRQLKPAAANDTRYRLGMAYLRLGETQNCCRRETPEACILPIRGGGIHTNREGSTNAIGYFSEVLANSRANSRRHVRAQWLNDTRYRLGMAYLRLGETQNCCRRETPEACILPIRGGGIHTNREGSTNAIGYFSEVLANSRANSRRHVRAQWLLNLAYMTLGKYPHDVPQRYLIPPDAFESEHEIPRFENIAPRLGLNTFNLSGGAIVDDFDNDGYLDILTSTWHSRGQIRYFRNTGGNSKRRGKAKVFAEQTVPAGLQGLYGGLNLVHADYDNDGYVDALVLRGAWRERAGQIPNSLLRNNGDGTFTDVTFDAGLGQVHYPTQTAAWADYDNDGDLDLYIGNENSKAVSAPCQLFRNEGNGTFTDVAQQAGVENLGYTKGVIWGDYNDDRFPDLYVSNLGGPNHFYQNNGDGTFTNIADQLDVTGPLPSFPVWFWDFDNDGVLDLYVASHVWWDTRDAVADVAASYLGVPVKNPLAFFVSG